MCLQQCGHTVSLYAMKLSCQLLWDMTVEVHVTNDARHEKTDLKVFVVVIPKEGCTRMAVPILLLARHRLFRI